jgi:hypothetical protein
LIEAPLPENQEEVYSSPTTEKFPFERNSVIHEKKILQVTTLKKSLKPSPSISTKRKSVGKESEMRNKITKL